MSEKSASEKLQDELEPLPEEFYSVSSDTAYTKAKQEGWEVVLPKKNELFLDFDNATDYIAHRRLLVIVQEFYAVTVVRDTPSPSGKPGHHHVVLKMHEDITETERVLLQAALGSDRKRELLAWVRIKIEDKHPTLFFEKPKSI